MRFVIVSDVHSHYSILKEELKKVNFNPEEDTLISCGDCLDRGDETVETIKFLLSLPKCVLVRGNHDILMPELLDRGFAYSYDNSNGTTKSYYQILNYLMGKNKDLGTDSIDETIEAVRGFLKPLYSRMMNYCELKNYIFCHAWIPSGDNWRNAHQEDWNEAMWGNPFILAKADKRLKKIGKTIVFGHYHTSYAWSRYEGLGEFGDKACFDSYYGDGYIGIDACTAYSGQMNVVVIEDEFDPEWYSKYGNLISKNNSKNT